MKLAIAAMAAALMPTSPGAQTEVLNYSFAQTFPVGNLLENGSFEGNHSSLEFEGWSEGAVHDPIAFQPLTAFDNGLPRSGRRFAGIRFVPPAGQSRFLVSKPFPLKPNTWYTFFAYYQTSIFDPADGNVFSTFRTYRDRNTAQSEVPFPVPGHAKAANYTSASQWTLFTHRVFTGAGVNFGDISLLSAEAASDGGSFYFDDAYLAEGCIRTAAGETLPATCPDNIAFGEDARHPDSVTTAQKFFDGNEKPIQTLAHDGPRDIVTQTFYDDKGRAVKTTLPIGAEFPASRHQFLPGITGTGNATDVLSEFYDPSKNVYLDDPIYGQAEKYPDAGGVAYSEVRYEASNLGRQIESAGPGAPWAMGGGHTTVFSYSSVPNLDVADDAELPDPGTTSNANFFVKVITSPDGQVTREFTDRLGRLVRASSKLGTSWVITDYDYDDNGNLVSVFAPPDGRGTQLSRTMTYDALGRMRTEATPSTGMNRFYYDAGGRVRFSQTEVQAGATDPGAGKFSFVKYDALSRVIQTGEITDGSFFLPEKAELLEFPCASNCEDPAAFVPATQIKVRVQNRYDDDATSLSCSPDGGGDSPMEDFMFLGINPLGEEVSATYELVQTYEETASRVQGQTGFASILALYNPAGELIISPRPGSDIVAVGNVGFDLEAVDLGSPSGIEALAIFKAFRARQAGLYLGPGEFLQGRLAKTATCNYELAEAMGETSPREVSKTFRYDKYGNVTKVLEINEYAQATSSKTQLTLSKYDVQNRLAEKRICSDILTDSDCNGPLVHVEMYRYDRIGRVKDILDKSGNVIVHNHYNYIGQSSARGLGGPVTQMTPNGLLDKTGYNPQGWVKSLSTRNPLTGQELFRSSLTYEGTGPTARFDGNISFATFAYGASTGLGVAHYGYQYDDLNRLVSSVIGPGSTVPDVSSTYQYLNDGRLARMTRDVRSGDYFYTSDGRLQEVRGNLVEGRDMSLATQGNFVFDYDDGGNLITDKSKEEDGQPLEIYYRSDNLPYMFTYKKPIPGGGYDDIAAYMVYSETGNRVAKSVYRNNLFESGKNYFGSGKEVRDLGASGNYKSLEIFEMAGVGRTTYTDEKPEGYKEYYLRDHLGSTREVYDFTLGTTSYASHYYPYGKQFSEFLSQAKGDMRMAQEGATKKFTGKELDEGIDLMYFGARYYDQDLGLWISPDPARQYHGLYSYTGNGNNPVNGSDPDGTTFDKQGKDIYKKAEKANFHGSKTLKEGLQKAYNDPKNHFYVEASGDAPYHTSGDVVDGVREHFITLPKNISDFSSAHLLRHESEHGYVVNPRNHDLIAGVLDTDIKYQNWLQINMLTKYMPDGTEPSYNFPGYGRQPLKHDPIYYNDWKVQRESGKKLYQD